MTRREVPLILLDTNAWIAEHLLTSSVGKALEFYLRRVDGRLLLPEIVEAELLSAAGKSAREAKSQLRKAAAGIGRFSVTLDHETLTATEVQHSVRERLEKLSEYIEPLPLALDDVRLALKRVLDEKAPNTAEREEFRDSVLWEVARRLASDGPVAFVTDDGDYYQRSVETRAPRPDIDVDIRESGAQLSIHQDVAAFLRSVKEDVPAPTKEPTAEELAVLLRPKVANFLAEDGFAVGDPADSTVSIFQTEVAGRLALSFSFVYPVQREASGNEPAVVTNAIVKGSCFFEPRARTVDYADLGSIRLVGVPGFRSQVYFFAGRETDDPAEDEEAG